MINISIIIPHKNSYQSLTRLLSSIPYDDDIEVIVVDDKSDPMEYEYGGKISNLKFISNTTTKSGAGVARNIGLSQAEGKWLIFADADDVFVQDAFLTMKKYINSDCDVIYFAPISVHDQKGEIANRHRAYLALVDEYLSVDSIWIRYRFHSPCSKMIRTSLVKENNIQFDETMVANDMNFSVKIGILAAKIDAVRTPIYCITQSYSHGLSSKRTKPYFDVRLQVLIDYNALLKRYNLGSFRMSVISYLRKSASLGIKELFETIWICIVEKQPFFDRWDYYVLLYKRRQRYD